MSSGYKTKIYTCIMLLNYLPTTIIVKLNPLLLDVVLSELYNKKNYNHYGIITHNVIGEIVERDVQKLFRECH